MFLLYLIVLPYRKKQAMKTTFLEHNARIPFVLGGEFWEKLLNVLRHQSRVGVLVV